MSRTLTTGQKAALYAAETSAVLPILIRLEHSTLATPLYFVNNTEDLTYSGQVYTACAFKFNPPDQGPNGSHNASIIIDGTDGTLIQIIQAMDVSPVITTIAAYFDTVIEAMIQWSFTLQKIVCDGYTIQGELVYDDNLDNEMGPVEMTAQTMPGLF